MTDVAFRIFFAIMAGIVAAVAFTDWYLGLGS